MNCRQIDKYLYDYCDNLLTPDQKILFEQHLAHCHVCRQAVDQALLETSVLREEWDAPDLSADFTSRVMEQIAAVPISSTGSVTAQTVVHGKLSWLCWVMGMATTAAIFLMIFYGSGIIKNQNTINMANREQVATESVDEKVKAKSPITEQNEDFLVGGKGEMAGNADKGRANQEQPDYSEINKPSLAPTSENESDYGLYGVQRDAISEKVLMKSLNQNGAKTKAATDILSVQPVNLPSSYTMLDKVAGAGYCTYIFGTENKKDKLTINIVQLPLHQPGKSSYSRSNTRALNANDKTVTAPAEPAGGNVAEKATPVEQTENIEILTQELSETHTISYEVEHNQQIYLLTITANLSPQELMTLSQNLQLQSSTP